jgi:hypothetical protein
MSESDYPRFLRDLLGACPEAGAGVHPWLFKVARYLHRYHKPEEICDILQRHVVACGRELEPHEIPDAVKNSGSCQWEPSGKTAIERRAEWLKNPTHKLVPEFDPNLAIRTAAAIPIDITPAWLKARSKIPVSCPPREYLESIFQLHEKAIIFSKYKSQGYVWPGPVPIERWGKIHWPDGTWFLCNPIDGLSHFNPRLCKNSQRSQESVTSFRYGVLECDQKPREKWRPIWLKILAGLALPIVSITDSGGSSDHALVRGDCESKEAWDKWKREVLRPLVPLGADDGALSAVRLTRLPNCYRGDHLQELLYLNPAADGTPIFYQSKGSL